MPSSEKNQIYEVFNKYRNLSCFKTAKMVLMFKDEGFWKSYHVILTISMFEDTITLGGTYSAFNSEQVEAIKLNLKETMEELKAYLEVPFNELPLLLPLKPTVTRIPEVIVYGRLKAGI